jgi:hypothetical protein
MFDPTAPVQIAAWIVAGILALLSGGCADIANMKALDGSGRPFWDGTGGYSSYAVPVYIPAEAPQRTVTCFNFGTIVQCH